MLYFLLLKAHRRTGLKIKLNLHMFKHLVSGISVIKLYSLIISSV